MQAPPSKYLLVVVTAKGTSKVSIPLSPTRPVPSTVSIGGSVTRVRYFCSHLDISQCQLPMSTTERRWPQNVDWPSTHSG